MDALLIALGEMAEPARLGLLVLGVSLGLLIGVIPGVGGLFGLTILVPVTYGLDPYGAFALLIGMSSVTTTSDTVPAVLLGVPGTVGSAATAIDGHALAKKGEADRALGAAYSASLIGGILGALLLALALPVMRPLVLLLNYGDLLAVTVFGLTLVSLLSGGNQLRGLMAAMLGLMVAYIGLDPYEGEERWTFGEVYLWDGVPTAIVFLGLFGLSELASLSQRSQIAGQAATQKGGVLRGMGEALREWPLVLRGGALGAFLGAVPGVGVTVIEWIAYGDAARRPGKGPKFGEGNIRGVIAPEAANNAKEGGALLPTLAFGIPGSATMAILLGAFAIQGIVPGPEMLQSDAPLLITMILCLALANIMGTTACLFLTPTLARVARVPSSTLVPLALVFVVLGAMHTSRDPRDLLALMVFGAIGVLFKRLGWSRPAFALGFVLGPNLERFFVLSYQISGWQWLAQPVVLGFIALGVAGLLRKAAGWRRGRKPGAPDADPGANLALTTALTALLALAGVSTLAMPGAAGIFPGVVALFAVPLGLWLIWQGLRARRQGAPLSPEGRDTRAQLRGDARLLAGAAGMGVLVLAIGHVAAGFAFVLLAAALIGRPSKGAALLGALGVSAVVYAIFDMLVHQSWPQPWVNALF